MGARVLIVDDHPLTRDALSSLLGAHGFDVCGMAEDGAEAVREAGRLQPDLVLLDLSMPGIDGLSALPAVRSASPGCEVVVLTASGTEDNLLAAIRAGAAGYLLKTEPPERIAEFLEGVVHGEAALSGSVARRLLDRVRTGSDHVGGVPDAKRLYISEHTVRSHVKSLLRKLGVSSRREALEQLSLARAA
jgi:DNA-binding NarL/FixJ family response regulator